MRRLLVLALLPLLAACAARSERPARLSRSFERNALLLIERGYDTRVTGIRCTSRNGAEPRCLVRMPPGRCDYWSVAGGRPAEVEPQPVAACRHLRLP